MQLTNSQIGRLHDDAPSYHDQLGLHWRCGPSLYNSHVHAIQLLGGLRSNCVSFLDSHYLLVTGHQILYEPITSLVPSLLTNRFLVAL